MTTAADSSAYSIQTRGLNLWYGDSRRCRTCDLDIKPGLSPP